MGYIHPVIKLRKTAEFAQWFDELHDKQARARIQTRFKRLSEGNLGDHRNLSGGVFELRIHHGPGYRVYCTRRGATLVIVLAGGDKSSQDKDIQTALRIAKGC